MSRLINWTPARVLTTGFLFSLIGGGVMAAQALQVGLTLSDPRWWVRQMTDGGRCS